MCVNRFGLSSQSIWIVCWMSLLLKRFPIPPNQSALLPFSTFQRRPIVLRNFGLSCLSVSNRVDSAKYHRQNTIKFGRRSVSFQSLELYALLLTDTCFKTERASQKLAAGDIPDGWSDNHYRLKSAAEAFPAEDYGLPPANLILVDHNRSTFLVECEGKYFLWNDISNDVARIDEPIGLSNILQTMKDFGKLKTVRLEMPGALEPPWSEFHVRLLNV